MIASKNNSLEQASDVLNETSAPAPNATDKRAMGATPVKDLRTGAGTGKVQVNVYMSPEHRERLRTAAIDLSGHASMGDIVAALIDEALERVVDQLADTQSRLRRGRKVNIT